MTMPWDARIQSLAEEARTVIVFVGSFGGKFTTRWTEQAIEILSSATRAEDIALVYVMDHTL